MFCVYLHKSSLVYSRCQCNSALLSKDNYELKIKWSTNSFPSQKVHWNQQQLALKRGTILRRGEHAVFAQASPLLKAINPSQTARLFSSNGQWNKSQKENRHTKHRLPSCSIFSGLIKSISIPRFGFNIWAEFRLCFRNQRRTNTKQSFVALRPSILLFPLLINL